MSALPPFAPPTLFALSGPSILSVLSILSALSTLSALFAFSTPVIP